MNKSCKSIYQYARNYAGMTQEDAAKRLNISPRTLAGYEAAKPIPHNDIVMEMVYIYGTKWLGYLHLRHSSELGMMCLPQISIDDVAKAVLVFKKESNDVVKVEDSMIAIACDGKIEKHEEQEWEAVSKELTEMAGAAISVVLSLPGC